MIPTRRSSSILRIPPHRLLELSVTLAIPNPLTDDINVGHVPIAHHALDADLGLLYEMWWELTAGGDGSRTRVLLLRWGILLTCDGRRGRTRACWRGRSGAEELVLR